MASCRSCSNPTAIPYHPISPATLYTACYLAYSVFSSNLVSVIFSSPPYHSTSVEYSASIPHHPWSPHFLHSSFPSFSLRLRFAHVPWNIPHQMPDRFYPVSPLSQLDSVISSLPLPHSPPALCDFEYTLGSPL